MDKKAQKIVKSLLQIKCWEFLAKQFIVEKALNVQF